jgi:hypothetical protein
MTPTKILLIPALLALGLAGCVESRTHLASDFGAIVNQNRVAQITDPDARYPQPVVSDGARVGLAMERYRTGKTVPLSELGASSVGAGGAGVGAAPK